MRTALITGVVGQDGAYLARHLSSAGYRVIGTRAPFAPPPGFVEAYLSDVDVRTVDLRDRVSMFSLLDAERPDEIYNLASISSVGASWGAPVEVAEVNGVAALSLLEAVRELRARDGYDPRILQASSAEIFGNPIAFPQDESHPIRPTNPYGVAKAFAHLSAINCRDAYGMFVSTVILFNHESPLRPASFVTRKITTAAVEIAAGTRDTLDLGRLDIRRDWGAASEYTEAMHLTLKDGHPDDFVLATGTAHPLGDFVELAFHAAGVEDPWRHVRTDSALVRPTDTIESRGDARRIRERLGWEPRVMLDELVACMVSADRRRMIGGIEHDPLFLGEEETSH